MNEIIDFGAIAGQIGQMGTFLLVFMAIFWYFKSKRKSPNTSVELIELINVMVKQIDDLHRWHNKDDDEGVKIWYVRGSLEKAIVDMTVAIQLMTSTGRENSLFMKMLVEEIKSISEKLSQ